MSKQRTYFCIDMKTFYASVECAERGLNPFETNLVVADVTRGSNALCLAISPKLKAQGVRNRCRLNEIPKNIKYEIAPPRMQLYIDYAADIYSIYGALHRDYGCKRRRKHHRRCIQIYSDG